MARTAVQATLDKMEELLESLEDTKAETETVIDDSVVGIETPLDTMSIALQNGKESNQENPSGCKDSTTPPLNKGKAKINMPQDLEFKNIMKTLIRTTRVYKTFSIIKQRLPKKD